MPKNNNQFTKVVIVSILVSIFFSCNHNPDRVFIEKGGFRITLIDSSNGTYIIPDYYNERKHPKNNYLLVDVTGGIVPFNHLVLYKDSIENKTWVGYTESIIENHLNSNYILKENENEISFDSKTGKSRIGVADFDIFYYLYGRSR